MSRPAPAAPPDALLAVARDSDELWRRVRRAVGAVPEDASTPPDEARVGAVLALFEDHPDGPRVVLTRRRRDLRSHPGQLSFPGGRVDPGETAEEAALREAREEIDLRADTVEIAGTGPTFFIPPSRFWVVPVVGRWRDPHELDLNPWEVEEVLHVPVVELLEPERWRYVPLSDRGAMWAWELADDLLWGATAMMVAALLDTVLEGWSGGLRPEELGAARERRPWDEFPAPTPRVRLEGVPDVPVDEVPVVTAAQVRAIDQLLREDAHVELAQLLEHAGRAVADAVRRLSDGDLSGVRVSVLAGPGGNGAAGMAAARLLGAAGAETRVALVARSRFGGQVDGLRATGIEVHGPEEVDLSAFRPGDVVVDAMLGVGARPPVDDLVGEAIAWLRRHDVPVVAVDLPSGVHPDTGLHGACVTAEVTVALAALKPAHRERVVRAYLGDLYLADLGIPVQVWRRAGLAPVEVFGRGPLVRLVERASA